MGGWELSDKMNALEARELTNKARKEWNELLRQQLQSELQRVVELLPKKIKEVAAHGQSSIPICFAADHSGEICWNAVKNWAEKQKYKVGSGKVIPGAFPMADIFDFRGDVFGSREHILARISW
jgi:hypothetical protein